MEEVFFGLLCSALALVASLLPIVALVFSVRLRDTVRRLERRVDELEALAVRPRVEAVAPRPAPIAPMPVIAPLAPPVAAPVAPPVAAPVEPPVETPPPTPAVPQPPVEAVREAPVPPPPAAAPLPVSPPADAASEPPYEPPPYAPPPAGASRPPPRRLGADALGVWALAIPGGLALLLAAIFALREAIAAGFVGPGARFALGASVGMVAVLSSEFARARRYDVPAAALGGGGAGIFYAVIYAGHARYALFGQEIAFGLMVATTAVTLLVAERRDSRFMASLALVGGYLTPILLSTGENKAVAFFGYLTLLDAGMIVAASRRRWTTLLGISGLVTAALYLGWTAQFRAPDQVVVGLAAPAIFGLLYLSVAARRTTELAEAAVAAAAAGILFLCAVAFVVPADSLRTDRVSGLPLSGGLADSAGLALAYVLVVPTIVLLAGRRRAAPWIDAVGVTLGAILLVSFSFGYALPDVPRWGPVAAALVAVPLLTAATGSLFWVVPIVTSGLVLAAIALPGEPPPMLVTAGCSAALAIIGATMGQLRGPRPVLVPALLASAFPLLTPLATGYSPDDAGIWFLGCAVVYVCYAFPPFWRPRPADLFGALSASLAGPMLFFPFHRLWVDTLGDSAIGALPVMLGMVTLLAAVTLVRAVKVRADDRELAILLTVVLLFISAAVPLQLSEAWLTVGWAIEVALLGALSRRLTHPVIRVFGGALAMAVAVRLLLNPDALDYGGGEGLIILNWTLYTWGIPGVALLVAAHLFDQPVWFRTGLRTIAVLLFFALVNLEVAHAFAHDDALSFSSEHLAESMTRSIAWASYGLLLIAVGTARDSRGARLAGLSFALLGALKVFVVDLWSLSGFARVGSFAGLAVTLLVGAVAFQRIVLKDRKP
ncbi:MAG: DUF2339 domain-containing protein [Pseudomonadota bacterium]|nr:DUF2339 domain-containing protein [Pseudomonadota bacterium]